MPRALATLFAVALATSSAAAQDDPSVEDEHRRGMEARMAHRDLEARDIFQRLYARTREPRALARQALAEGAMGAWVAAEEHLVAALEARDDPWIRANRAPLDENLALFRSYLASLDVVADAAGAELFVDDTRVASLPLPRPLRVVAGEVHFEVRAPGRVAARWRQRVAAGETPLRVVIELPPAPPSQPLAPQAPAASIGAPPPPPLPPPPAPPTAPRAWMRPVGVTALAVGAVGVVAGAVLVGLAQRNEGRFDAMGCRDVPPGARSDCDGLESDTVERVEPAAAASFTLGGALLVGGVALWLLAPRAATPAASACGPAGLGLQCAVRF